MSHRGYYLRIVQERTDAEFAADCDLAGKLAIPLAATGTGAGVLTLRIYSTVAQVAYLTGLGAFYSDAAGTTGKSPVASLAANAWATLYIKVPSGTANLVFGSRDSLTKFGDGSHNLVTEAVNAPKINGFDTKYIPSGVKSILVYTNLHYGIITGTTYAWPEATSVYFAGNSMVLTGTTYAWPEATSVYFAGTNMALTGPTYAWPAAIQVLFAGNSNIITADLSTTCVAAQDFYIVSPSSSVTYAVTRSWPTVFNRVYLRPSVGSMPTSDVDRLANDCYASMTSATGSKLWDCRGNCGAASAASATARAGMNSTYGITVYSN